MNHEIKEKEKIINFATERYLKEGFYKTSMDTMAKELQISKKTIYKNFGSKEELVEAVIAGLMVKIQGRITRVIDSDQNAVEKVYGMLEVVMSVFYNISEAWIKDLKIHANPLWLKIDEFRTKKLFMIFTSIIEQGKKEELIKDFHTEIMLNIFISVIRSIVSPEFYFSNKFSYNYALKESLEVIFNGILTKKGKVIFSKSLKRVENEKI